MRILAVVISVLLIGIYAFGSGRWVSTSSDWYLSLQQPAWQPPNAVFGLAWAYNFTMLIVVGILMSLRAPTPALVTFLVLLAVSIALAIGWSYLFYGPHALVGSAICLTLCAVVTVAIVVVAWSQAWWLGAVMLPYLLWLAIASSLSWGYVALNGSSG